MKPRHIAISGDLGSGKTTVARKIASSAGWDLVGTGDIHRAIAARLKLSTLETNLLAETDRAIDDEVDGVTRQLGQTSDRTLVFDSRVAWHLLSRSFKVRLILDPRVAVQRIFDRGASLAESYQSFDEAARQVNSRYESERRRFSAIYGVDVARLRNYDLVIDTSDAGPDEVAALVLSEYEVERESGVRLFVSPSRTLCAPASWQSSAKPPKVVYFRPYVCAVSGCTVLRQTASAGHRLSQVELVAEGNEEITPGVSAEMVVGAAIGNQAVGSLGSSL